MYLNLNCVELALFRIKNVLVSKNSLHNKPKNLFVIDRDNGFLPRILISKLTQANCFLTSWQEYRSHFFFQSDNLKHSHWKGLNLQSMQWHVKCTKNFPNKRICKCFKHYLVSFNLPQIFFNRFISKWRLIIVSWALFFFSFSVEK